MYLPYKKIFCWSYIIININNIGKEKIKLIILALKLEYTLFSYIYRASRLKDIDFA